jgi:2-keto-4-pentenoate hydratase
MLSADASGRVLRAATLLAAARQAGTTLPGLPPDAMPQSLAEAEAVQRATFAALGLAVGGWKVGRAGPVVNSAPMPPPIPADAPLKLARGTIIEFELALRFRRDLTAAEVARLTRDSLPALADLVPLFEWVQFRYAGAAAPADLEKVADCVSNGGFTIGAPTGPWGWNGVENPSVRLLRDGEEVATHTGPHRAMPLAQLIEAWQARVAAEGAGVREGQVITLGSLTGLLPVPEAGCTWRGEVAGRGALEARIAPC